MNHTGNNEPVPGHRPQHHPQPYSRLRQLGKDFARIESRVAAGPNYFLVRGEKRGKNRVRNATLRCQCQHPKSIHARMYANQSLGTACNFPGCRCKAYKPGRR